MKELLEAGVHFGHQTKRWNPKMKPYIFGERNGIYIIDLQKTVQYFKAASNFITDLVAEGGTVLFVGTKKQAHEAVEREAQRCDMYYVNQRWLGGTLTNFRTIRQRVEYLKKLDEMKNDGVYEALPKKEVLKIEKERLQLTRLLSGIRNMEELPGAMVVIDPRKEKIAVNEARKLDIPIVGLVDTNCDPEPIDYVIPGNDDAIRAINLILAKIADAVLEGREKLVVASAAEVQESETQPPSEAQPQPEAQLEAQPELMEVREDK